MDNTLANMLAEIFAQQVDDEEITIISVEEWKSKIGELVQREDFGVYLLTGTFPSDRVAMRMDQKYKTILWGSPQNRVNFHAALEQIERDVASYSSEEERWRDEEILSSLKESYPSREAGVLFIFLNTHVAESWYTKYKNSNSNILNYFKFFSTKYPRKKRCYYWRTSCNSRDNCETSYTKSVS